MKKPLLLLIGLMGIAILQGCGKSDSPPSVPETNNDIAQYEQAEANFHEKVIHPSQYYTLDEKLAAAQLLFNKADTLLSKNPGPSPQITDSRTGRSYSKSKVHSHREIARDQIQFISTLKELHMQSESARAQALRGKITALNERHKQQLVRYASIQQDESQIIEVSKKVPMEMHQSAQATLIKEEMELTQRLIEKIQAYQPEARALYDEACTSGLDNDSIETFRQEDQKLGEKLAALQRDQQSREQRLTRLMRVGVLR